MTKTVSNHFQKTLLLLLLTVLTGCSKSEIMTNYSQDSIDTVYPNVIAAKGLNFIEEQVEGGIVYIGAELEVMLEDNTGEYVYYNFSEPFDIGYGTNMMVINGAMSYAFLPDSLNCFLQINEISLIEISRQEASELNNISEWMWYENKFYQFVPKNWDNTTCLVPKLLAYGNGNITTPARSFPRQVIVELKADLNPLDFSQPELTPYILLNYDGGNMKYTNIKIEYDDYQGHKIKIKNLSNDGFILDDKLKIDLENGFWFPFDSFTARIYNITPRIIEPRILPISIKGEENLIGHAIFQRDSIDLIFKRSLGLMMYVTIFLVTLIFGVVFFIKNLNSKDTPLNHWSSFVTLLGLLAIVTQSLNVLISMINLILIILVVTILSIYIKRKWK